MSNTSFPGGGASMTPGVFNSSFDPPLFQNYTINAVGAQAAINLTANPIDTQGISWRLGSNGVITSITDTMTYANGDLHTANANWVEQAGSFSITSNVAYGSNATTSLAYRSDGPNTGSEWAQATMTITGNSQATGPCVRMSTSASTAYCLIATGNLLEGVLDNAGSLTVLQLFSPTTLAVTGDILRITAIGSTISMYRCPAGTNCVLLGSVIDTTITSGETGIWANNGPATQNGISNFQSGVFTSCNLQLDSSPDGVNWTLGGALPSQACVAVNPNNAANNGVTSSGSFQLSGLPFNYVRVNVTALTAGQTLNVIYSGRIASTPPVFSSPVSNGQWVNAGEVLWAQFTTQQNLGSSIGYFAGYRLQTSGSNGTSTLGPTLSNSALVTCNTSGSSGLGFAVPITQSGWLNSATAYMTSAGAPQGSLFINMYVLPQMPVGGSTTACSNALSQAAIGGGMLLTSCTVGSSYPCSFVGTSAIPQSPWAIPGFTTTQTISNPAAGAEFSGTLIGTARTCVQGISFTLAAGSTNVNPTVVLTVNSAKLAWTAATAQTSATTQNYSFSPGAGAEAVTAGATVFHIVPFNNGQMVCFNAGLSTATVSSVTTGLNGTTAYTAINVLTQVQQDNN